MDRLLHYFTEVEISVLQYTKNPYDTAYYLVSRLFAKVKDKGGHPYIEHLKSVAEKVEGKKLKTIALLHDVIEDSTLTAEDLLFLGFSREIVDAVLLLTRKQEESYEEFINRLLYSNNLMALLVKKADLENNMDLSRLKVITEVDQERVEKKYKPQYKKIIKKIEEREK